MGKASRQKFSKPFPCTGCGVCCTRLTVMPEEYKATFPFVISPEGVCSMFENGKCKVYDQRPEICRVNKMAEKQYKNTGKPKKEYYREVAVICNQWMDEDGIDESYNVDLKQFD